MSKEYIDQAKALRDSDSFNVESAKCLVAAAG